MSQSVAKLGSNVLQSQVHCLQAHETALSGVTPSTSQGPVALQAERLQSPEKAAEAECHKQEKADAKEEARKVSLFNSGYCTVSFNMRSASIDSQTIYHQKKEAQKAEKEAEKEAQKAEKEAEKERLRLEKEAQRAEKEAEKERLRSEKEV